MIFLRSNESLWRYYDLSNRTVNAETLIKLLNRGLKTFCLARSEVNSQFFLKVFFFCSNLKIILNKFLNEDKKVIEKVAKSTWYNKSSDST